MKTAFYRAAAHIEQNPRSYSFFNSRIPGDGRGEQGCMVGWAAHFAGEPVGEYVDIGRGAEGAGGHFTRLLDFAHNRGNEFLGCCNDPRAAAKTLRGYAKEAFKDQELEDPTLLPPPGFWEKLLCRDVLPERVTVRRGEQRLLEAA